MDLKITVSENMKESLYEHRMIRMSKALMSAIDKEVGEFLYIRNKWGGFLVLQIGDLLPEDNNVDLSFGYVTKDNYQKIFLKQNYYNEVIHVNNITLGCDPEAFLIDPATKNIIAAHRFLRKCGDVGHDGLLLEFRPQPHVDENIVINNITNLIKKARFLIDKATGQGKVDIVGASGINGLTAGFHLHYGLPKPLLGHNKNVINLATIMTKAFDYYIGVPSIIPEGSVDNTRRTLKFVSYGKPGGFRLDNRTFEYRLPGGINLRHPILAKGLIALGAVVVEDLVSRLNISTDFFFNLNSIEDSDLYFLYPNLPNNETLYAIICNPEITPALNHLPTIKNDIRKMVGYERRQKAVEMYFKSLENKEQFDWNIERNWGTF